MDLGMRIFCLAFLGAFSFSMNTTSAVEAVNGEVILDLKTAHLATCVPAIARQLRSIGVAINQDQVQLYCECLGTLYFNELTRAELQKLSTEKSFPRLAQNRKNYQEYCGEVHFK